MQTAGSSPGVTASNPPHNGAEGPSAPQEVQAGTPPQPSERFRIVGIGASAGGLRALEHFFKAMQPGSGMAFIVVQHIPSDRKSELPRIIQQHTPMTVCEVDDGAPIEPNCVYVIPPSRRLTVEGGRLRLSEPASQRGHSAPVDLFLRSLAEDQGPYAAGVILSGRGTDGSAGLRAIKETGGVALVQDPSDAEYDGMPNSAIATRLADFILPADGLAAKLMDLMRKPASAPVEPSAVLPDDEAAALQSIFAHLHARAGHDFTQYKRSTVLRRLERRMLVHQVEHLADYQGILLARPEEVDALLKSLLINVTYFFRDDVAFQALRQRVIPRLFSERDKMPVRVWVPGCATGEEAYTLAMLLMEHAEAHGLSDDFQVFATDIDPEALDFARHGLYSEAIAADLIPERLDRFFTWEGEGYRVRKELREKVLFALHSLVKDPPFSRIDLVSCRNVLIYLNRDAQEQVFDLFHYALRPEGYLFLGLSESADRASGLFATLDKKHHIFQCRTISRKTPRLSMPMAAWMDRHDSAPSRRESERRPTSFADIHSRLLLERYAPASVLVTESDDIVHISGNAAQYLQISEGDPTQNILHMVRKEFRIELRTSLHQARRESRPVRSGAVRIERNGERCQVNLYVAPIKDSEGAAGFIQIIFEERPVSGTEVEVAAVTTPDHLVEQLEDELLRIKGSLQATIEDLERSNDELKASNEELLSTNEELQSTAEELETSREELQSMNEELITVNHELKEKVEEVSRGNNDLQNLIVSTDIGTIFLDRQLRIKRYTPRATDVFNITPLDVGRPLAHFTHRIDYDNLLELAERVLHRLMPIEREIRSRDGRWYLVRLLPYRTLEDKIDGIVITFVDMTDRRRAESILNRQQQQLRALIENAPDIIARFDRDFRHVYVNPAIEPFSGMARQNFLGKSNRELDFPEEVVQEWEDTLGKVFETGREATLEFAYQTPNGPAFFLARLVPEFGPEHTVETVLSIVRDITDRKRVELALRESERRFRSMADTAPVMIWVAGTDKDCYYFNKPWLDFTGRSMEQEMGGGWSEGVHPDDVERRVQTYSTAFDAREAFTMEYRLRRHDGTYRWILDNGVPQITPEGAFAGYIGSCVDVHDQKELEARLRQRALQQAAVAEMGLRALGRKDVLELMTEAAGRICSILEVEYCKVMELQPDRRTLLLRAGTGWKDGYVGVAAVDGAGSTFAGFTLRSGGPVIVRDMQSDQRFEPAELLRAHGAVSGMSVIIGPVESPYGVLSVHTTAPRDFSQDDQNFLQAIANLLNDAVERAGAQATLERGNRELDARVAERTQELQQHIAKLEQAQDALQRSEDRFRDLVERAPDAIFVESTEGIVLAVNPAACRLHGMERDELIGKNFRDLIPPEQLEEAAAHFHKVVAGEMTYLEGYSLRSDGTVVPVEVRSSRITYGEQPALLLHVTDISRRKEAEEALRQSEVRWRGLVEHNPDPIIISAEGKILYSNPAGVALFGAHAEEDLIGHSLFDFAPPTVHDMGRERLKTIEGGSSTTPIETRLLRLDGTELSVETFSTPIVYDGRPAAQTVVRDITSRRKAEEALRHSEERWRTMVERNPDPIVISAAGKILYSNPAGIRLIGASSLGELLGHSISDFAPPGKHAFGPERLQLIESGRPTTLIETRLARLDGSELDVETFSTPIIYEGNPAVQTVIRDITRRKRSEEVVRRSEERFAKAFRGAPVAMIITRLGSGRIVDANDNFMRMTGFSREEVIGRKAVEVGLSIHRILRDRVGNILEEGDGYEDVEAQISTKQGARRDVISSGEVIEFSRETCLLSMFYDITERKRLEQEVLEIAEGERRRIGQDLHDGLGQQLTGIAFLSKLLEQNLKKTSPDQAAQMQRVTGLLAQAISYTRNLSRVLSPVDVQADALADALRRLGESTQEYFDIRCRFEAAPDVRAASNSAATHLYRIAQEAVNNALKHAAAEEIVLELIRTDGQGTLHIRDNGRGIPEDVRARSGGLGMRTMQYRANAIGGHFALYPAEGGGTVIEVRFPLASEMQD